MFWLTIISSIASIISLLISFFDYFKKWKTYLLYVFCTTAGITIGVLTCMSESAVKQFTNSQLIYLITLVSLLGFLSFFVYRFMTKTYEIIFVSLIIILTVASFIPNILNSVERSQSFIKPVDYVFLSNYYQDKGDFIRAADFLKRYKELDDDNISKALSDSLDKKISDMRMKAFNK